MADKVIGVLGGMGPEATLDLFEKIIRNTPARADQDHLRVLIDSNPKIPDRTQAILHGGDSPVPLMAESARALERAGADFIVIPCVSAHFFLEEVQSQTRLPILSIFEAVAEGIERGHPEVRRIGLLATSGTVAGGQFQRRLAQSRIDTLTAGPEDQQSIMSAIYDIKGHQGGRSRSEIRADVRAVAGRLAAQGAQGIIAGCTEIPLVLRPGDLDVPVFDSLLLLARAAILAAGREPLPMA